MLKVINSKYLPNLKVVHIFKLFCFLKYLFLKDSASIELNLNGRSNESYTNQYKFYNTKTGSS